MDAAANSFLRFISEIDVDELRRLAGEQEDQHDQQSPPEPAPREKADFGKTRGRLFAAGAEELAEILQPMERVHMLIQESSPRFFRRKRCFGGRAERGAWTISSRKPWLVCGRTKIRPRSPATASDDEDVIVEGFIIPLG